MKTIIIIFLIALTVECSSQIMPEPSYINQLWKAEFGANNQLGMVVDAAGNIYVIGSIFNESLDWLIIKYSPSGERLWYKQFNEEYADREDIPHAIAVDNLGNVYVTGESYYLSDDYLTIKYNSQGTELWQQRYGGPGQDIALGIALDENRNVYVTGKEMTSGNLNCVTLKYSSAGTLLWEKQYDGPTGNYDMGTEIAVASDGSIYVAGRTESPANSNDYLLIKYNSSGAEQWVRTFDGPAHGSDVVRKMVLGYNNAIFLTGYSDGDGSDKDYLTIKYSAGGTLQWSKRYNGPVNGDDRAVSLAVDDIGNTYVTGYSMSTTGYDYATVKYSLNGTFQWLKREDGGNNTDDYANDITVDNDGNIYVTGKFKKANDDYQMATVKYSSSGNRKWVKKYIAAGKVSEGRNIFVDGSENIIIGGMSDRSGSGHGWYEQFLVVKYTQSPYIIVNRNGIPNTFSISQNYPNPFNPVTKISFSIPNNSYTKLIVYDISGKQVAELVNNELEAGEYNIDFDASHLASGTYFYRIAVHSDRMETGGFTEVKKMILVK
ncbi:MAG: PKD repeat protein [Chlorobi bacterium OLB5]|nr:MAG: PKD repeat protein [Chlorobi bacterium OLB5]